MRFTIIDLAQDLEAYDGRVWEIHPLVVAARHRRKGIGRALSILTSSILASASESSA